MEACLPSSYCTALPNLFIYCTRNATQLSESNLPTHSLEKMNRRTGAVGSKEGRRAVRESSFRAASSAALKSQFMTQRLSDFNSVTRKSRVERGEEAGGGGPATRSLSPKRPPALHRLHFPTRRTAKRSHKGSEWPVSGAAAVLVWAARRVGPQPFYITAAIRFQSPGHPDGS